MDLNQTENINTGSIDFQIIKLREQVKNLQIHLSKNKSIKRKGNLKDIPAKRALLTKVAKIKRFLKYLARKKPIIYQKMLKE